MQKEITNNAVQLSKEAGIITNAGTWPAIVSQTDYEGAGLARKDAKTKIKALNTERLAITRPMDEAKKRVMEFFKAPVAALEGFVEALDAAMLPYIQKKEEEERLARIKAEAEAEERRKKEEEEALALAAEMEEAGEEGLAEEIVSSIPQEAEEVQVETKTAKAEGTSTRKRTVSECFDKMALIKAVAAGQAPERLLDVNTGNLQRFCEATGTAPAGCKQSIKTSIVTRT